MIPNLRSSLAGRPFRACTLAATTLLLAALAACSDSTGPTENGGGDGSLWDTSQDQIFFVSTRAAVADGTGGSDIYRMNADGTGVERLTEQSAAYRDLRLSPDGTKLAYYSDQAGCYNIWVMNLDGTDATQLTSLDGLERCNEAPRWSPDGTKIAFQSSRNPDLGWDVYVMNADGSGVVNVSNNPSSDVSTYNDLVSGWTPDGRVVMQSNRTGTYQSYVVNVDGSTCQPLFADTFVDPYWSPDGTKVVATMGSDVYTLNADGSDAVNLTNDPSFDGFGWGTPWSPDGGKVAFRSMRTGGGDLFVVNADGTGLTNVTNAAGDDTFLGWSPDGTKILFSSARSGTSELYVVSPDGSGLVNLTNDPTGDDDRAVWVPKK